MPVSHADYAAISDHFARYCWHVDEGEEDAWIALWAEDATLTGLTPQPLTGREALRQIVRMSQGSDPGKTRHMAANLMCDYRDGQDRVSANYYNYVTNWAAGGRMVVMALSKAQLVRSGEGWLIERQDSVMFMA